jgi:Pvc16 N-terminal domain
MADYDAIAAVSRTLRTLLLDRMVTSPPTLVTIAPPDVPVEGMDGARVNLYLIQVIENPELKNQEIPGKGYPAAYGKPPLSLNLRYLATTYSASETQPSADLNAQSILGDAMRVLHDFGNRVDSLLITNPAAGIVGDPILDSMLTKEFERIKVVLHPTTIDDITKIWSALAETNFRRSVIYEVTVVQIETIEQVVRPQPVETRRVLVMTRRRPVIRAVYVSSPPSIRPGEYRARVGDEITIESEATLADKLYVRLGTLDPIRVTPSGTGYIRIIVPDDTYPVDLDHPVARPIPVAQQLQVGSLEVELIAEHPAEGVAGGLDHGAAVSAARRYGSNIGLLQLVPLITGVTPPGGNAATILHVVGARLWSLQAHVAEVIIADAAVRIRHNAGDPWAAPTPTVVEIPVADAAQLLPVQAPTDPPYPVAVQVDGARSRDAFGFRLGP